MEIQTDTRCTYPVGDNIGAATRMVDEYIEAFHKLNYDGFKTINLWCRGSSGAILAAIFATKCGRNCKIVHVKKPNESSHGISYPIFNGINVVIDDFVSSGYTITCIIDAISHRGVMENCLYKLDVLMVCENYQLGNIRNRFEHIIGKR